MGAKAQAFAPHVTSIIHLNVTSLNLFTGGSGTMTFPHWWEEGLPETKGRLLDTGAWRKGLLFSAPYHTAKIFQCALKFQFQRSAWK